jgi:hypothetical protein
VDRVEPCELVAGVLDAAEEGTCACTVCHCRAISQLRQIDVLEQHPASTAGHHTDIVSINNLVVFERVKVVLDMDRCLLDDPGAEEGIRGRR